MMLNNNIVINDVLIIHYIHETQTCNIRRHRGFGDNDIHMYTYCGMLYYNNNVLNVS